MKLARGYFGRRKNVWTVAKNAVEKGLVYAYRDRKQKKRNFRSLWIQRINAGARLHGLSYSQLIHKLNEANVTLNRKVLADLAMNHPDAFKEVVEKVKKFEFQILIGQSSLPFFSPICTSYLVIYRFFCLKPGEEWKYSSIKYYF